MFVMSSVRSFNVMSTLGRSVGPFSYYRMLNWLTHWQCLIWPSGIVSLLLLSHWIHVKFQSKCYSFSDNCNYNNYFFNQKFPKRINVTCFAQSRPVMLA